MQVNEQLIRTVVSQVLAEVGRNGDSPRSYVGRHGVFNCVNEAVSRST